MWTALVTIAALLVGTSGASETMQVMLARNRTLLATTCSNAAGEILLLSVSPTNVIKSEFIGMTQVEPLYFGDSSLPISSLSCAGRITNSNRRQWLTCLVSTNGKIETYLLDERTGYWTTGSSLTAVPYVDCYPIGLYYQAFALLVKTSNSSSLLGSSLNSPATFTTIWSGLVSATAVEYSLSDGFDTIIVTDYDLSGRHPSATTLRAQASNDGFKSSTYSDSYNWPARGVTWKPGDSTLTILYGSVTETTVSLPCANPTAVAYSLSRTVDDLFVLTMAALNSSLQLVGSAVVLQIPNITESTSQQVQLLATFSLPSTLSALAIVASSQAFTGDSLVWTLTLSKAVDSTDNYVYSFAQPMATYLPVPIVLGPMMTDPTVTPTTFSPATDTQVMPDYGWKPYVQDLVMASGALSASILLGVMSGVHYAVQYGDEMQGYAKLNHASE